jgi:predicted HAD superfamily Cof-like phosphohydrolase
MRLRLKAHIQYSRGYLEKGTTMAKDVLQTSESYDQIKSFMAGAGQGTPGKYQELTQKERVLRARLILEEALETIVLGLGVKVVVTDMTEGCERRIAVDRPAEGGKFMEQFNLSVGWHLDPVEFVDGCLDLNVVCLGGLIASGLPDVAFRAEVDQNNLLKIANGHQDENGKFLKPKNHPAPDIAGILEAVKLAQNMI